MKLLLSFFFCAATALTTNFAHAANPWITDTDKAVATAKTDKKPLLVWFAAKDATLDGDTATLEKKFVLLKVERGTKDEERWRGGSADDGKTTFAVASTDGTDSKGLPFAKGTRQHLPETKLTVALAEEWALPFAAAPALPAAPMAVVPGAPAPVVAVPAQPVVGNSVAEQVLAETNRHRAAARLQPLQLDPALCSAAQGYAQTLNGSAKLTHSAGGTNFVQRSRAAGFTGSPCSENAGRGHSSATDVVNGWMNSAGHRANILDPNARYLGVGQSGRDWVQVFGR